LANSTTKTSIIDRALQILGMKGITSPQEVGSRGARSMLRTYDATLLSELTKNYWAFAIKRAELPASGTPPVHTKTNLFPLPGDFLMLAPQDQYGEFNLANDWIIEGNNIVSDESGPIYIRYVSSDITENQYNPIFAEALSAALAIATGEELTNSAGKVQRAMFIYDNQISEARKNNSIISQKPRTPVSSWISARG